jgi:uncharacterized protein
MTPVEQMLSAIEQAQFPHLDSLIHLFVGGSELHGAKVKDTDDLDIYGVYLEPPEFVLGLDRDEFFVWSTAENERRNGPDDIDVCLYSLRKWAGLAAKGNPTALHFLFAPNHAPKQDPRENILNSRDVFLSRQGGQSVPQVCGCTGSPLTGDGYGQEGAAARTNWRSWIRRKSCDARRGRSQAFQLDPV